MSVLNIRPGVDAVGVDDPERRLFDELIPLPDGTSYNAYLVRGAEKIALIDTVDPPFAGTLFANLKGVERIDYVVANHAEQDHSGAIPAVLERFPMARIVTDAKCRDFLVELLAISPDKFDVVEDGARLPLGGKTLTFRLAPWVHWPETMVTWLEEDQILFPCDLFGSHVATGRKMASAEPRTLEAAKRYYAEIMMPFRPMVRKNLDMLAAYTPALIAPSHGPIHDRPRQIVEAYRDWTSDTVKNEVVLPYVSMHGSVKVMTDHLAAALERRGIAVKVFDLPRTDIGALAIALVDAATLILGAPALITAPHPTALHAATVAGALKPKTRFVSFFGSYLWGHRMKEAVTAALGGLKADLLEPVIARGLPKAGDLAQLDALADAVLARHQSLGIAPGA